MARSYNKFDEEYKKTIVELYENGKTVIELEREYGIVQLRIGLINIKK